MANTFEALKKAEKKHLIIPEETKILDLKARPKPRLPSDINIPPQITEEYHRMKNHILNTDLERKNKTLLFSSSTQGEGNTTVLINFAITLVSGGEKVLLVDANLRNPTFHDLFNLEKKSGLTELLLEKITLKDVIKKTQIKNLLVITSGTPHSNPFSVFESKSLDYLIAQMNAQADWVIFDSPPINSYNDSSTLAAKMDGVVMVVQAEKTRWEVAQSARQQIENGKVKILGAILNRRKMHIPEWAYKIL